MTDLGVLRMVGVWGCLGVQGGLILVIILHDGTSVNRFVNIWLILNVLKLSLKNSRPTSITK